MRADHSEHIWEKTSCALQRLVMTDWFPIDLGYPSPFFPEQGPAMKAVSSLSLESRDLFWLLEVEETKRAAA